MFEFAISQHRNRRPTKRLMGAWAVSALGHAATLLLLIQYPGLLRPGLNLWFRQPLLVRPVAEDPAWRTVTFVGSSSKMTLPSAATLRQLLGAGNQASSAGVNSSVPIRGGDELASAGTSRKPAPLRQPALGTEDPKPSPAVTSTGTAPEAVVRDTPKPGSPVDVAGATTGGEKKSTFYLPPPSRGEPKPEPKKVTESAENIAPTTPPTSISPPDTKQNPIPTKEEPKVFENEQKAIRTEGSGLFDTKGFPLGEYASLIIERIKGNWSIPSNLRNNQGRSTVIFYIEKNGQLTGIRVVNSSGSRSLDDAALQSIWVSSPLPPLPKGFPGDHVGAKFVFSYNEPQ